MSCPLPSIYFFFNDTPTTEIYTLSLHDALPICCSATWPGTCTTWPIRPRSTSRAARPVGRSRRPRPPSATRSEEHTSELQSQFHLVCRLLLEKKKKKR